MTHLGLVHFYHQSVRDEREAMVKAGASITRRVGIPVAERQKVAQEKKEGYGDFQTFLTQALEKNAR
ncbi:hypothetical protein ACQZV8_03485 [Magnetococcales bacterium HHB-1]